MELRAVPGAPTQQQRGGAGGGDDGGAKDTELALSVFTRLADQELTRADRSSARLRQAFALAAGFFVVVQTVAFGSFNSAAIKATERVSLVHRATLAAIVLAVSGVVTLLADFPFRTKDLTTDLVLEKLNESRERGESVADDYVELYAAVVDQRRETNRWRFWAIFLAQVFALATIGFALSELIFSLHARR